MPKSSWLQMYLVEEEGAYQAWLAEQQTFAQSTAEARNEPGEPVKLVMGGDEPGASRSVNSQLNAGE